MLYKKYTIKDTVSYKELREFVVKILRFIKDISLSITIV